MLKTVTMNSFKSINILTENSAVPKNNQMTNMYTEYIYNQE